MNDPDHADPLTEPPNSTVDDWHGQEVQRDTDAADRAVESADGDMEQAERIFEEQRPDHPSDEFKVDATEREGTLDGGAAASDHRDDASDTSARGRRGGG